MTSILFPTLTALSLAIVLLSACARETAGNKSDKRA